MHPISKAKLALELLKKLEEILEREDGQGWIPGVEAARRTGEQLLAVGGETTALEQMSSIYRGMHAGPQGFDDFFVWRDSTESRSEANAELNRVKDQLWQILGR